MMRIFDGFEVVLGASDGGVLDSVIHGFDGKVKVIVRVGDRNPAGLPTFRQWEGRPIHFSPFCVLSLVYPLVGVETVQTANAAVEKREAP